MSPVPPSESSLEIACPLAFFDLETTGVDVATNRIVELAILKLLPDGAEQTFHTLINQGVLIPASASEIHGIRDKDVRDKPEFRQIADDLLKFLEGYGLAGFNIIRFDLPVPNEKSVAL